MIQEIITNYLLIICNRTKTKFVKIGIKKVDVKIIIKQKAQ